MPGGTAAAKVATRRDLEDGAMGTVESRESGPLVTAESVVAGAMLFGIGSMLCVTGLAISTAALAAGAFRWISEADVAAAPTEFARQQWTRAVTVSAAGARMVRDRVAPAQEPAPAQQEGSPEEGGSS
jgi:hypothetical protein